MLRAIDAAREAGLTPIKINMVVLADENVDQVVPMVERFGPHASDTQLRFIEFMPWGLDKRRHVPAARLREMLGERWTLEPLDAEQGGGPATNWRVADNGLVLGFISPITEHFCSACNRLRLMADGDLRTCLSRDDTPSLRDLMRGGASDEELELAMRRMVWGKIAGHEAHLEDGDFRTFEGG